MRLTTTLALFAALLFMSCAISFLGYRYLLLSSEYRERNLIHLDATHKALDLLVANPIPRAATQDELKSLILTARAQAFWCVGNLSNVETRIFESLGAKPALNICEADMVNADLALEGVDRLETALLSGHTGRESPFSAALKLFDRIEAMRADSLAFQPYVEVIEDKLTHLVRLGTLAATGGLALIFGALAGKLMRFWRLQSRQTRLLERANQRFTLAIEASSDGFAIYDEKARLVACNEKFKVYSHPDPAAVRVGMMAREIVGAAVEAAFYTPESVEKLNLMLDMDDDGRILLDDSNRQSEEVLELVDGRHLLVRRDRTEFGDILVSRTDITQQVLDEARQREHTRKLKDAKAEIELQSLSDPLTGLANRRKLDHDLERRVAAGPTVLIRIDLDRFKQVNDVLGHEAGDFVLCHVADILRAEVGEGDLPARVGGDEFVILCGADVTEARAEALAGKILEKILKPLHYGTKRCVFGASFGVALSGGDEGADDLLRNADAALYEAKTAGRGTVAVFTPEMRRKTARERALAGEFEAALEAGQIVPFFHSQHRASCGEVSGAEVLARWRHPGLGLLPPAEFIPIARQLGMEARLDAAILRQTVEIVTGFDAAGLHLPRIAFNLSLARLRDPLFVQEICEIIPDDRERFVFEVVESVSEKDANEELRFVIDALKISGFGIFLDNFGSGHASINSVFDIEPDGLKIDRHIVSPLGQCDRAEILVSSILDLARSLGAHSIAEGVDDRETARTLANMGCEVLQGFLFSRPMAPDEFRSWLEGQGQGERPILSTGTVG